MVMASSFSPKRANHNHSRKSNHHHEKVVYDGLVEQNMYNQNQSNNRRAIITVDNLCSSDG